MPYLVAVSLPQHRHNPNKACGPDNIPVSLLKITAVAMLPILCCLFNMSLSHGSVPAIWRKANITPIHKDEDPSLPANYRPVSLLCILSKVLERCVVNRCFPHISRSLYHLQYGFRPGRLLILQLVTEKELFCYCFLQIVQNCVITEIGL